MDEKIESQTPYLNGKIKIKGKEDFEKIKEKIDLIDKLIEEVNNSVVCIELELVRD